MKSMMNMIPYEGGDLGLFDESDYETPNRILIKFAIVEHFIASLNDFLKTKYRDSEIYGKVFGSSASFCGDEQSDVDLVLAFRKLSLDFFFSVLGDFLMLSGSQDFELSGWEIPALERYNSLPGVKKIEAVVPMTGKFCITKQSLIRTNASMLIKLQISVSESIYLPGNHSISFDLSVHEYPLDKYDFKGGALELSLIDIEMQKQFYLVPRDSFENVVFRSLTNHNVYRTRLGGVFAMRNIIHDVLVCECSLGVFFQLIRFLKKFLKSREIYGQTRGGFPSFWSIIICARVIQIAKSEDVQMSTKVSHSSALQVYH